MKKGIAALLALCLLLGTAAAMANGAGIDWTAERRARLTVGNPTAMRGRFFTSMWGGTTGDLDVQDLLHACSPVRYDIDGSQFLFDSSVVQDAIALDDEEGNRTYLIVLYDDMMWSDGTPITASDYAFSILLCMDPAISETGGTPMDYSWIVGAEEYLARTAATLAGVRIIDDDILQIRVKAEALPYFYELSRLMIHPYPVSVIAPGLSVADDGEGAYLSGPLTAEMIRKTVLDEQTGYLSHPSVVSGPYTLSSFDGTTAVLSINPYFKGTEDGTIPRIGEVEYTLADNADMIAKLKDGEFGLLDKVTMAQSIRDGISTIMNNPGTLAMENEPRVGLTLVWFMEGSAKIQDNAVRQAIACCFDRDAFIREYAGQYGIRADGLYGLGQWTYRLAKGLTDYPAPLPEEPTEEEQAAYDAAVGSWEGVSLDGLTAYQLNTKAAVRLLEKTGWTLNESGKPFDPATDTVRCKQTAEGLTGLRLTMAMPESPEARQALETHFAAHLREAGIALEIIPIAMEDLEAVYHDGRQDAYDMLYLGEDFSIIFDPAILAPGTGTDSELRAVKEELYAMAQDMVHTDPKDLPAFMRKWVKLQERISETLPLIPVYTNVYFDFFSRELHDFRIDRAVTWGEAVVKSYMSDIEELTEEELATEQEKLDALNEQFPE